MAEKEINTSEEKAVEQPTEDPAAPEASSTPEKKKSAPKKEAAPSPSTAPAGAVSYTHLMAQAAGYGAAAVNAEAGDADS